MKKILIIAALILILGIITTLGTSQDIDPAATDAEVSLSERDYAGLTLEQALEKSGSLNIPFRIVILDGQPQPTTRDYLPGRINATVTNGVVVSFEREGRGEAGQNITQPVIEEITSKDEEGQKPNDPQIPEEQEGLYPELIGLTIEEAQSFAQDTGIDFRIGSVDGEPRPVTADYRIGRITASTVDGVVVDYSVEG